MANHDEDNSIITDIDTMQSWFLGAVPFCKPETVRRELKEFRVIQSINSELTENAIRSMFLTNNFHRLVPIATTQLDDMICRYIPKYFTTFMNTEIELAELIFGLTDNGEVNGVIVDYSLTENDIFLKVLAEIDACIIRCFGSSPYYSHYMKHIRSIVTINMVEMSTRSDDIMIDDWSESYLEKQSRRIKEIERIRTAYNQKMHVFTERILYYRRGINTMLNDPNIRIELVEFIQTFQYDSCTITSTHRQTVIEIVRNIDNTRVVFRPGQIMDELNDPNNLAFWVTKFRDLRVEEIQKDRPRTNVTVNQYTTPLYTGLLLKNPIARIANSIHNTTHSKIVVIQIILPGQRSIPYPPRKEFHPRFSYLSNGEIKSPTRCINSNGPSCV